ncbi:pyridoxamine 5'-phosphate oxidase family protein [Thermocatellispora tengchongensis]|nr:pyridoxamine 5'-phosphate oxidase family protein [Thermocatellispora tengchongensis]
MVDLRGVAGFWKERHLCTLSSVRADGTPHVVPVGVTLDEEAGIARVITSGTSYKARRIAAAGPRGVPVAVCQVDGRRWSTLEGVAVVRADAEAVAEAERRYAERYRTPRVNPNRVVIEIRVTRVLGNVGR